MYVLAVANQKGGVGKTTTAANVANVAAARGRRVLLVDLDPQGSLTRLTDAEPRQVSGTLGGEVALTVSDALHATQSRADQDPKPGMLHQVVVAAGQHWSEHLSVAPANQDMAARGAETFAGAETRLAASLRAADDTESPDLVIIDCPPTLGTLVLSALHAADGVLVVTEPADGSVEGLPLMQSAIEQVRRERRTESPALVGIVATNVPAREQRAAQLLEHLREQYGEQLWETVPRRAAVRQAEGAGAPISAYGPREGADVQAAYDRITDRVLSLTPTTEGAR